MSVERRRVIFEGRVQGVGFRFTSERLASGFEVSGTVRNLPDGRVELDAQGEPDEIQAFLTAIRAELGSKIHGIDENPLPLDDDESPGDFRILY